MKERWVRALVAAANGAKLALIVLVLTGTFGGGLIAKRTGASPGLCSLTVIAVAVLGALAAGTYCFWRDYHREDPPPQP